MKRRHWIGLKLVMISSGFLGLTIVTAFCVRTWTSERPGARVPASLESGSVFEHRGDLNPSELAMLGSTVLARGRRVVFNEKQFRDACTPKTGYTVPLNLFPDLTLTVRFQPPSSYRVNEDIFVGLVVDSVHPEGDPESGVKFMIVDHIADGRITIHGREYRVINGGNGLHIVTETPAK